MAGSSELNRERWIATAVIAVAGIAWITGSHYPSLRIWGFNHLAFLPTFARIALGIVLAATLMIVWSVPLYPGKTPKPGRKGVNPLAPAMIIGWMMLVILLHAAIPLLGDGYLRGDEIGLTTTVNFGITEFLPGWIATIIQQGLWHQVKLTGATILAGLSSAAGVLFAVGLIILWPRALGTERQARARNAPDNLLSAIWILTAGSSVIFFGYVESYGLTLAFFSLLILAILAHRNGRLGWGWPVVLWMLAAWSHLAAVGWVPALLYAMYERRERNQPFVVPLSGALAAVAGTLAAMFLFVPASPTTIWSDQFLPIVAGSYSMLSISHLVDLINHAILIFPASFLLIRKFRKTKATRQPFAWGDFLIWGPTVFALFTFNPKLGWWRDWDLFALLSAPAVVLLALALARRQGTWTLLRRAVAASLAIVSFSLWVWVNASATASVARFSSLLALDTDRALTGYEGLARYCRDRGDWVQTVRVLGRALTVGENARLRIQRGIGFSALNMPDSGLAEFGKAIAADSTKADGYFGYGQMLWLLDSSDEALPYLNRAVAMDSTNAQYRYQLGQVLSERGEYVAALPHLAYAARTVESNPSLANTYATTLFSAGESDSAIAVLQALIERHPTFGLAYSNLAWAQYQQGDIPSAASALDAYERRVRPTDRVASSGVLRQKIDSIDTAGSIDNE